MDFIKIMIMSSNTEMYYFSCLYCDADTVFCTFSNVLLYRKASALTFVLAELAGTANIFAV